MERAEPPPLRPCLRAGGVGARLSLKGLSLGTSDVLGRAAYAGSWSLGSVQGNFEAPQHLHLRAAVTQRLGGSGLVPERPNEYSPAVNVTVLSL